MDIKKGILESLKKIRSYRVSHLLGYSKLYSHWQLKKISKLIPSKELNAHAYITGKTGCGKSSLIEQWIYHQRRMNCKTQESTIIVLDPHGDTVERIRKFRMAKSHFNSFIYIDPTLSKDYTVCMNPLESRHGSTREVELKANQLVRAIEEMLPEITLTNHMRALLKPCVYVLLSLKSCTLEDLQAFMGEKNESRVQHGKQCDVKTYRQFFTNEFNNPLYSRTKQSIYTKIQSLLNSQVFYNMMIGKSTIRLDQEVRKGKVILFNLSKGKLGEEVAETMGRFIIAQLKSIALQRASLPPLQRKHIYLVIDEADTFIKGNSLSVILKETRKYGLSLILASQNVVSGKNNEALKRNLINNTNVKIIGANGYATLKALSQESGIEMKKLKKLKFHEFRLSYGSHNKKLLKPKNLFGGYTPLLISKGETLSQTHRILKETQYYKPKIKHTIGPEEWIDDFPENRREDLENKHYPKAKFSS